MMHVTEGDLQAYLDGELQHESRAGVEQHLAHCDSCTAELEVLRQAAAGFAVAVALLDSPAPEVLEFVPRVQGAAGRQARAQQAGWHQAEVRPATERQAAARRTARRQVSSWSVGGLVSGAPAALLRAAVVVLLAGGVAWGALPGSPLREWVGQLWREGAGSGVALEGLQAEAAATSLAEQVTAGVSVLPSDGEARVLVREPAGGSRLRVRLVEGGQVAVQWTGSGADPHFRTAPGRIELRGGDSGSILVEAPRGSRTLIEVEGRLIGIVEGGVVRPLVEAEVEGDEVVFAILSRSD